MGVIVSVFTCSNIEIEKHAVFSGESSNQKAIARLISGKYGDLSIAVSGDTVTGVYEYYDKWNESYKEFTDINVFYFYGRLNNGQFSIKAGLPGEDILDGTITYTDGVKLSLKDQPNGYAAVDFVDAGYQAKNTAIKNWIGIGLIKAEKAYLYKSPAIDKSRVYVVREDVVKIVERSQGWSRVEYNPPANPGKTFMGWIKDGDLYNQDPGKW